MKVGLVWGGCALHYKDTLEVSNIYIIKVRPQYIQCGSEDLDAYMYQ